MNGLSSLKVPFCDIWSKIFPIHLEFYPIVPLIFILSFIPTEILNPIPLSWPKLNFILLSRKTLAVNQAVLAYFFSNFEKWWGGELWRFQSKEGWGWVIVLFYLHLSVGVFLRQGVSCWNGLIELKCTLFLDFPSCILVELKLSNMRGLNNVNTKNYLI